MPNKNSWSSDRKLVLHRLNEQGALLKDHSKKLDRILESMGGMKAKIAVGSMAISGIIAWIVAAVVR